MKEKQTREEEEEKDTKKPQQHNQYRFVLIKKATKYEIKKTQNKIGSIFIKGLMSMF